MKIKKLWRHRWILRAIVPSIIFNFRHLPFKQARFLPILLYKPRLGECSGNFVFKCPVRFGLVKLGKNCVSIYPDSGISIENRGTIIFNGRLTIGNASAISVGREGTLEFGNSVTVTTCLKLVCYHCVSIQDNVLIGWNCMITDTDFHKLKYIDGGYSKGYGNIIIQNDTWIANGCKLYKNTNIPSYCVISSDTIIRGSIDCSPYSLIVTESTATVRKEGVFRDKNDDMINYLQ